MKIPSLTLICFSPTGTTKSIVQEIARGISIDNVELLDITRPDARIQPLYASEKELLIVGVPVYMGRVPALVILIGCMQLKPTIRLRYVLLSMVIGYMTMHSSN